jgi:dTDP-4-dehydrorhamnose reductase
MKVLVLGSGGQVGYELMRHLPALGEVVGVGHSQVDLADAAEMRRLVREVRPQVLVNAAAFTAVDKAEATPDLAMAINGEAPALMAQEMARLGGAMVHYSTDYVYNGAKASPYTEDDAPDPLSAYGRSKLAGDLAVQASGAAHLIFRTSWVYGARGSNFLLTMLRLFKERPELRIVDDQIGAPTWCRYIAQITAEVLRGWLEREDRAASSGVYHLTAGGSTSWFGFASAIRDRRYAGSSGHAPRLVPITTAQYPLPARRPANSVLSNDKLRRVFAVKQTDWREQLDACMKEIEA